LVTAHLSQTGATVVTKGAGGIRKILCSEGFHELVAPPSGKGRVVAR